MGKIQRIGKTPAAFEKYIVKQKICQNVNREAKKNFEKNKLKCKK